jgi:hypothetical protein
VVGKPLWEESVMTSLDVSGTVTRLTSPVSDRAPISHDLPRQVP